MSNVLANRPERPADCLKELHTEGLAQFPTSRGLRLLMQPGRSEETVTAKVTSLVRRHSETGVLLRRASTSAGRDVSNGLSPLDTSTLDLPKLLLYGSGLYSGLTTALHPLNVIKTRAQAFSSATHEVSRTEAVRAIVRVQGVRGLWSGCVTVLLGALPARMGYITALEGVRPHAQSGAKLAGLEGHTAEAVAHGTAGFAAALASLLIYVPFDVVSQRIMVRDGRASATNPTNSIFHETRAVLREGGWRGLFRGFGISAATGLPAGSIWWAAYGSVRDALPELLGPTSELLQTFIGGTVAAAATVAAVAPLDTLKTRFQLVGVELPAGASVATGGGARCAVPPTEAVWQLGLRLVRQDGFYSLYAR